MSCCYFMCAVRTHQPRERVSAAVKVMLANDAWTRPATPVSVCTLLISRPPPVQIRIVETEDVVFSDPDGQEYYDGVAPGSGGGEALELTVLDTSSDVVDSSANNNNNNNNNNNDDDDNASRNSATPFIMGGFTLRIKGASSSAASSSSSSSVPLPSISSSSTASSSSTTAAPSTPLPPGHAVGSGTSGVVAMASSALQGDADREYGGDKEAEEEEERRHTNQILFAAASAARVAAEAAAAAAYVSIGTGGFTEEAYRKVLELLALS
jgi:hypothetical protein